MSKNKPSLVDITRIRKKAKLSIEEKNVSVDNVELEDQVETDLKSKVGRPKGIRSNPDYESTTIRLHKLTKAKARYILSTMPEKMDLQTLLNQLLEDFVQEQEQH